MRLLQIARTLNPAWGGTVQAARTLSHSAKRCGLVLETLCQDDPGDPWLDAFPTAVHAIGKAPLTFGFSRALDRWLDSNVQNYDAIIVNGIWMHLSYATWKAASKRQIPYYVFVHGFLDPWFQRQYPLKHIKKVLYWRAFEHKVLRDAAAVLFTTQEEELLARGGFQPYRANAVIAGFGIETPPLPSTATGGGILNKEHHSQALRSEVPALGDRPYLLFLGRVHEKKGIDLLLNAYSQCKRQNLAGSRRKPALVIAGPGNAKMTDSLKALTARLNLETDVVWTGPLYGDAKWSAIRGAEAFVLPSHQENFGISVVEALACGTPVLISNKVNIWREVKQHQAGLVGDDTAAGTFSALQQWSVIPTDERERMADRAQECFARNFRAVDCARELFDLIAGSQRATASAEAVVLAS